MSDLVTDTYYWLDDSAQRPNHFRHWLADDSGCEDDTAVIVAARNDSFGECAGVGE